MRIGVDGRSLVGEARGIAHYTAGLLGALAATHPDAEWVVLLPGRGAPSPLAARIQAPNVRIVRTALPGRAVFGAGALTGRPRLEHLLGGDLDALWAPAPAPLAAGRELPLLLSLHDTSWVERPRDFTSYERLWHRLARPAALAQRAAVVLAVSHEVEREAIERLGVAPDRIVVVRNGIDRAEQQLPAEAIAAARARHGLPEQYVLAAGALEPRKGVDVLAAAFSQAALPGIALVFAGQGRLAQEVAGPGVHLLGHLRDDELAPLYAGALLVALPSRLEGFGRSPFEAAIHGTPSVVSDLPVLRELLGDDGARFVPAGDVPALAVALRELAGDPRLRARIATAAGERARALSWERIARDAWPAFERAGRA